MTFELKVKLIVCLSLIFIFAFILFAGYVVHERRKDYDIFKKKLDYMEHNINWRKI